VPIVTALTAQRKLELSQLDPAKIQREMMGNDVDLDKLNVYFKSEILFDSSARVIDVNVNRTIDGASTVDLTLNDYDRSLLRSGVLNARLDIEIDGLWFRLVKVSRDSGSDDLSLTFEQREIALLRTYPKNVGEHVGLKWANREKTTRAEFILNLIREVKEIKIPVIIPHLHQVQEIEKKTDSTAIDWNIKGANVNDGSGGIPANVNEKVPEKAQERALPSAARVTVKGVAISKDQRVNANVIISTGVSMKARPKVLVCAIMTAIQESTLHNLTGGDGTSVGLFQQIDTGWGSYNDRHDPATASRMFFKQAIDYDKTVPDSSFNDLCQGVQRSGHPDLYGQWQDEAQRIVAAYGIPPGKNGYGGGAPGKAADNNNMADWSVSDNAFYYFRGVQENQVWKREDNWTCIRRLADEVGWRAFFVSGVFYFLTDDDLFKTSPIATITESSNGVMGIGFDYDLGKKAATVDLQALTGLWLAPPGSIVALEDMGPCNGRWLVNSFARSLFNSQADINLTKPQPTLPEPLDNNFKLPTWAGGSGAPTQDTTDQAQFGGIPGTDGSREAVVKVAQKALQIESQWHYDYAHTWETGIYAPRPMPDTLWSADAHHALDCSSFATLCYKEAGCKDPNGQNYNRQGYTGTLAAHGLPVSVPQPGDLVLYGSPPNYSHVMVAIGGGQCIGIGGDAGVHQTSVGNYTAVRSYLP